MKKTLLFSTLATTLFLTGSLKAGFIDIPSEPRDCSSIEDEAGQAHCESRKACFRNATGGGQQEYDECLTAADASYYKAQQNDTSIPDSGSMLTTSTVTEVAESAYGNPQRDKGWKFAQEGE
jgi:hypothetical protein